MEQNAQDLQAEMVAHYRKHRLQPDDVITEYRLGWRLGNAIKYLLRCEHKGNKRADLIKAVWYICKELTNDNELTDKLCIQLHENA
jgi:hypothetical protein